MRAWDRLYGLDATVTLSPGRSESRILPEIASGPYIVFQLHAERRVWEALLSLPLHLDDIVFCHSRHAPDYLSRRDATLEVRLAQQ